MSSEYWYGIGHEIEYGIKYSIEYVTQIVIVTLKVIANKRTATKDSILWKMQKKAGKLNYKSGEKPKEKKSKELSFRKIDWQNKHFKESIAFKAINFIFQ